VGLGVAAVALAVTSGFTGAVASRALDDENDTNSAVPIGQSSDSNSNDSSGQDNGVAPAAGEQPNEPVTQAAADVLPSVVVITVSDNQGGVGQGSGVIISDSGLVLTNNHVVEGAAGRNGGELSVTLADGTSATADIVGRDPATDLAVIQLKDVGSLGTLEPARLGHSDNLTVGDTVLAIGSPLGLDGSVSAGIVSALNRAITLGDFGDSRATSAAVVEAIQTDAAINPGNSGGPLVNSSGEVVGINTAIASLAGGTSGQSGNIGVGFAIPIDTARSIVDQLVQNGEATHAYLGVRLADSGVGSGTNGAVIAGVEQGGPADDAGIQQGDIVTKVDGETVRDAASLTAAIRAHAPGDKLNLTVKRGSEEKSFDATLGTLPTADG
jgi:putative serine protease PepD